MPETLTWSTVGLILYDFCIRSFLIFVLPARAQEPSPVNAENGYGYYWSAQLGIPIEILHENEPIVPDLERLGSIDKCIVFPSSTFETGKHYSIQLVKSTDGGANYTSVGGYSPTPIPGTSTSVVAPADSGKNLPILNRPIGRIVIPGLRNWEKVTFLKHWSTKKERLYRLASCRLCRNILM